MKINWEASRVTVNSRIEGKLSFKEMAIIEQMLKNTAEDIVTGPENNDSLGALQLIADAFGIDMEQDFSEEETSSEEQTDWVEDDEQSIVPQPVQAVG